MRRHSPTMTRCSAWTSPSFLSLSSRPRCWVQRGAGSRSAIAPGPSAVATRGRDLLERWPGYRRDEIDQFLRRAGRAATQEDGDLTAREREVAALVARGFTNAAIAKALYISPRTAAVHVSNILAKLGLSNRSELTAWAVRSGLVSAGQ